MTNIQLIDRDDALSSVQGDIAGVSRISLDCEAAGFHRYLDRLSLVQLTAGPHTFLLDPLALDLRPLLAPLVEDPEVEVLMHGADYDLRLLDRDLGVHLTGLFDTQIAAALLGETGIGLSSLLDRYFGVKLSKQYQRADWAERPLSEGMLNYAAHDTLHLDALASLMRSRLEEAGRFSWAEEEFRELEKIRWSPPDPEEDPVLRVKGARDLMPREAERLRVALQWRDGIARVRDRALFRVAGDPVLLEIALQAPRSMDALTRIPGMHGGLARGEGGALLEALRNVEDLPEAELRPYPRPPRGTGRGRPLPEIEARFQALKDVRTRHAEALGIDRGTLIPNYVLQTLAETPPSSREVLLTTPSLRRWQAELLGDDLLETLRKVG